MKLQQNSLLALYSLVEFASDPMRHISAAEIAQKYQVSPHHLAKVLAELARGGIVQSVRGVGGGYRFAANARRLTLLDVISRFEDVGSGTTERNGRTPADRALSIVLGEIDEMAKATLKSITLATLLRLLQHKTNAAAAAAEAKAGP
ncbi:MAG: Rrf2 family transcriptional regulator [Burkholderiales bacterium]|nr:MAG: Rrf2 family transcriptional regulator [Burkholderiales bacterium]